MGMYSISGFDYDCCVGYDDYEPSAVISGKAKRQERKAKRQERKAKRQAKRTGLNCKGSKLKKVALAVPRNAFLSLVRLNVKQFAVKLYKTMQNPARAEKLFNKWCKLGGDASALKSAVNKAVAKYKRKNPGKLNGIGFAVESAISTATPIIIALLEFMKGGASTQDGAEPETMENEGETVEGIGAINPYLLAGAVGVGVYYLTKKRFI